MSQQMQLSFSSSPLSPLNTKTLNPATSIHNRFISPISVEQISFGKSRNVSSNPKSKKHDLSVKCLYPESQDKPKFNNSSPAAFNSSSASTTTAPGGSPAKFFVGHSIYKWNAVLTFQPRAPEFGSLDSGAYKLSKKGSVLLEFAPSAGFRSYDWSRKQRFCLSVTEIGSLISLGSGDSCYFCHDPFRGKSDEGKVRKRLEIEPLPDGSGHLFNLIVHNKLLNKDESIYIRVSKAEYTVLVSTFNYILPYILGWHAFANSIRPEDSSRTNNATMRSRRRL